MARWARVVNQRGDLLLARAKWCQSFGSRLRGLMFRPGLAADEGLILVQPRASIAASSLHMLFMNFAIAAIWLDDAGQVVHTALARPWRLYYASPRPARYVLEAPPALLDRVAVGDRLKFEE